MKCFKTEFDCVKGSRKDIYQVTLVKDAGFASYSQNNKISAVSLTVIFSGLTETIGGSENS